jgi:hypothetical protein
MSKAWIRQKKPEFVRDVVRDFCLAAQALEEQFRAFDEYGRLTFEVLRDLLGEENSKGLLWRLKDTAHHLFRNEPEARKVGQFLDWGLGYIFHETIKLKEDAYQQREYGPWFREMQTGDLPQEEHVIGQDLYQVVLQTRQSMEREIKRIRFIMYHCRRLFPIYLAAHRDNMLLARLLFEQNGLVRQVFGAGSEALFATVYADEPERMYILASQSLRLGGWMEDAAQAVEEAVKIGAESDFVLHEKEIVDNWKKRLSV